MKLNIKIDTNVSEPEALIVTPKMNEEVSKIVDFIEKLNGMTTVISGTKDDKVEILEQDSLIRLYAEGGKTAAVDVALIYSSKEIVPYKTVENALRRILQQIAERL